MKLNVALPKKEALVCSPGVTENDLNGRHQTASLLTPFPAGTHSLAPVTQAGWNHGRSRDLGLLIQMLLNFP
jgi:hypothetical protein